MTNPRQPGADYQENLAKVRAILSEKAIVLQVAEDAAALAGVACMTARIYDNDNPADISPESGERMMLSAMAEVANSMEALIRRQEHRDRIRTEMHWRMAKWAETLGKVREINEKHSRDTEPDPEA